jgi:mannosyltransferase
MSRMIDFKAGFHPLKSYQGWLWWLAGLALALRLFHLGAWSFWHDEALTILLARKSLPDLVAITAADVHPPLYFLLVKLFLFLGQSEFVVRLPSALCSVGAVVMLYLIGRDLFDERVGLVSSFIMAVSPLQLFYAQEARMYAQLLLLTGCAVWAFIRALRDNRLRWWGLFMASAALSSYTAYFSLPIFLAMALYVLLVDRRRERILSFGLSLAGVAGLYLPWLGVFFSQTRAVLASYWIETPHLLVLLTTLNGFFVGISLPAFWIAVSLVVTLFIFFAILNNVRHALSEGSADSPALLWLLLWLLLPLLGTYLVSLVRPLFQLRTVLTASLPVYLLIGWGITRTPRPRLNQGLFIPTLVIIGIALFNFYFDPAYAKPPWREAAAYVRHHVRVGDVVLHASDGSYLPFLIYAPTIPHVLLPGDPEIARINAPSQAIVTAVTAPKQEVAAAVHEYQRAWLVLGMDQAIDYQLAQKNYFDQHYRLVDETQVGGIYLLRYALDE